MSYSLELLQTTSLPRAFRDILGHAWSYYAGNFANTSSKDYVLAVSQSSLLNLRWCNFVPDASDVDQMVRIIDTFLPLCHGFLGKVFVQIPWLDIVEEQRHSEILVQAILRLIVKLAAEPQVRQVGESDMDVVKSHFPALLSINVNVWHTRPIECTFTYSLVYYIGWSLK